MDLTALGDPINRAARLQTNAAAGEVVFAADVYAEIADQYPNAEARTVTVRGRQAPVDVRVVRVLG